MTDLKASQNNAPNLIIAITLPILAAVLFVLIFLACRYNLKKLANKNEGRMKLKEEGANPMERLTTKELNIYIPVSRFSQY